MYCHGASEFEQSRLTQFNFKALLNKEKSFISKPPSCLVLMSVVYFILGGLWPQIKSNTCLCSENTRATRIFFCGHLVFLYRDLNLSKCLPAFYHEIITFWQDLIASNPKSKNDVLEQIVWNNKFIKSDKKSMYLQHWRYAGILKIKDLFDTHAAKLLSVLRLFS